MTRPASSTPAGYITGSWGRQFRNFPDPNRLVQNDDFEGAAISTKWALAKGSDAACVNFAINEQVSGVARGVTGANVGVSMATNGVQLSGYLNYETAAGGMEFAARVKLAAIANVGDLPRPDQSARGATRPPRAQAAATASPSTRTIALGCCSTRP